MMQRKKKPNKSLTASHYYAIGRVSASWAWFEWAILQNIADMTDMKFSKVAMLIGHMPFPSWLDVLSMSVARHDEYSVCTKEFDIYLGVVQDLYVLRNKTVHPLWVNREGDKVTGLSIPKRGRKIFHNEGFTSKQMKGTAHVIEGARLWLQGRKFLLEPVQRQKHMERLEIVRQILYKLLDKNFQRRTYQVSLKQPMTPQKK